MQVESLLDSHQPQLKMLIEKSNILMMTTNLIMVLHSLMEEDQ